MGWFGKSREEIELEESIDRLEEKITRLERERDTYLEKYKHLLAASVGKNLDIEKDSATAYKLIDVGRDIVYNQLHSLYMRMNYRNWSNLLCDFLVARNNEKILESQKREIQADLNKVDIEEEK